MKRELAVTPGQHGERGEASCFQRYKVVSRARGHWFFTPGRLYHRIMTAAPEIKHLRGLNTAHNFGNKTPTLELLPSFHHYDLRRKFSEHQNTSFEFSST